jgi:hypothetical protein
MAKVQLKKADYLSILYRLPRRADSIELIPFVLFRLPPQSTARDDPSLKIPDGHDHQRELRLHFYPGCPSSRAAHFAANVHRHVSCLYAWRFGAFVKDKDARLICAELSVASNTSDLVFRVTGETHGEEIRQLLQGAVDFVGSKLTKQFPGLTFDAMLVCPACPNNGELFWSEVARETVGMCGSCWNNIQIVPANESPTRHVERTIERPDSQEVMLAALTTGVAALHGTMAAIDDKVERIDGKVERIDGNVERIRSAVLRLARVGV